MRAFRERNVNGDACFDSKWSLKGKVERATHGPIVAMYSSMRSRVFGVVSRKAKISSMRHCEQMRIRMSSGRCVREVGACCGGLRRVNDTILGQMQCC
jgi:hypothetical protein